jgi:hypothetical protein
MCQCLLTIIKSITNTLTVHEKTPRTANKKKKNNHKKYHHTNKVKTMARLHAVKLGNLFNQYTEVSTS